MGKNGPAGVAVHRVAVSLVSSIPLAPPVSSRARADLRAAWSDDSERRPARIFPLPPRGPHHHAPARTSLSPAHQGSWSAGRDRHGMVWAEAVRGGEGRVGPVIVEMCIMLSRGAFCTRDVRLKVPARVRSARLGARGSGLDRGLGRSVTPPLRPGASAGRKKVAGAYLSGARRLPRSRGMASLRHFWMGGARGEG